MTILDQIIHYIIPLQWFIIVLILVVFFRKVIAELIQAFVNKINELNEASTSNINLKFNGSPEDKNSKGIVNPPEEPKKSKKINVESLTLEFFNRALEATQNNNHLKAVNFLKKANILMPNQWVILHNLGVELIRYGRDSNNTDRFEYLIEAEEACKNAIIVSEQFPYGTFYNLARAQASLNNIIGLKETLSSMAKINLHEHFGKALAKEDQDIHMNSNEIKDLKEYKELIKKMKDKYKL